MRPIAPLTDNLKSRFSWMFSYFLKKYQLILQVRFVFAADEKEIPADFIMESAGI